MIKRLSFYSLFTGYLLKKGSKIDAKNALDFSFFKISHRFKLPLNLLLNKILRRMGNLLEMKSIQKRKSRLSIPFPIRSDRRIYLLTKRIIDSIIESKIKKSFEERLADEFVGILRNDKNCKSLQKTKNISRQAVLNKSNTHFRW